MDITVACRDTLQLNIMCQVLLEFSINELKSKGVLPLIVETYRSQERQNYLYSIGRTIQLDNNKVTWTLNSIHTKRNAVDVVPVRSGKAIWNASDYQTIKIVTCMTKYGFEAGANWSNSKDSPHFQIKGVSETRKSFSPTNTNVFITNMIKKNLNTKLGLELPINGVWDYNTTRAVNKFKGRFGWLTNGLVNSGTLRKLLS